MNIVLATSDFYSKPAIVTIKSLLMNNTKEKNLNIYYIENGLSDENKNNLLELVNQNGRSITFITMPEELKSISGLMRTNVVAYTYCFLQDILPKFVEKVLLIEADTIVVQSLKGLYNTDIEDYYLAAVDDLQSKFCKEKIGIKASSPYFNCGVLLINLKKMREDKVTEGIRKIVKSGKTKFMYEVQDEMNFFYEGRVKILPPKYNFTTAICLFSYKDMLRYRWPSTCYTEEEFNEAKVNPTIVHFTKNQIIQSRPWMKGCMHPYRDYYLNVMAHTCIANMQLWDSDRKITNRIVNFIYSKVSKSLVAWILGGIHAYFYPKYLYRYILR